MGFPSTGDSQIQGFSVEQDVGGLVADQRHIPDVRLILNLRISYHNHGRNANRMGLVLGRKTAGFRDLGAFPMGQHR